MSSHRIHLRGPWDFFWQGKSGTATMPQEWRSLFGEQSGAAEFRRKFHRPTNLDPHERVMIVFTEIRGTGRIQLNDMPVGEFATSGGPIEFDITNSLNSFNILSVVLQFDPGQNPATSGGLYGPVALDIRTE